MSYLFPDIPDPSLRQPATLTALAPVFLIIYAQAVLAILPNTFILKLSLLPFILWQTWSCAVGLNLSMAVAKWLGFETDERFRFWNFQFAVAMLVMASRSFEWTFIKKPLRKYELPEGRDTPIEHPLSVTNVLLDALDLFFNQRGIGWSWSSRPFPRESAQPSIPSVLAKTLLKFAVLDIAQYILDLIGASIDKIGGDSLFDTTFPVPLRTVLALLATFVHAMWTYTHVELMYDVATLIGRILLRQPASHWPPFFRQPWMATSIRELWSVRWHQCFRHFFVVFGARPCGMLLGRRGAVMGAFAASGLLHIVGWWATGHMKSFHHEEGFFLLMGIGVILESEFEQATGRRVAGWLGRLWTAVWMISWGSYFLDSRLGGSPVPVEIVPDHVRPGKVLINGTISLFSMFG